MKRRRFLSLVGAAGAVPMIPALPSVAAAPVAAPATVISFNQFTYGLAALHTRIEGAVPLADLAKRFGLSPSQTEVLAQRLVSDGLAARSGGTLTARHPIVQGRGFGRGAGQASARRQQTRAMPPLLAHLRKLSADYGMILAPVRLA